MKDKIKFLALTFTASVILLGCNHLNPSQEQHPPKNQNQQMRQENQQSMMENEMKNENEMGMEEKSPDQSDYIDINAKEAKRIIEQKKDLIIIDVSPKYDQGHLPGAVNYYVGDGSLDKAIPTLDKDKPYLVYCHVDSASIAGAQKLVDAGFTKVYRLEGNYSAWKQAGYKIEK